MQVPRALAASLLGLAGCVSPPPAEPAVDLVLTHVHVIPCTGEGLLPDCAVHVADGRIVAIEPAAASAVPASAAVFDGQGGFLIPGLVDMHGHLPRGKSRGEPGLEEYFDLLLAAGVTTVRTMRGADGDVTLRDGIRRGERDGPRLLVGSPGLDGSNATDPSTARGLVRAFADQGYDFVKVLEGMDRETFEAILAESATQGMRIAGHLPDVATLDDALAEFWSLEHLHGHAAARAREPSSFAELARRTAESGMWVCPTLGFQVSWYGQATLDELSSWPGVEHARSAALAEWRRDATGRLARTPDEAARQAAAMQVRYDAVRDLAAAGVGLVASASGGWFLVPGFSLHVELACLARAGIPPAEVLRMATANAARCAGETGNWGTLQEGAAADMVVLAANPLERVENARQITAVVRAGRLWRRSELDARLARWKQ